MSYDEYLLAQDELETFRKNVKNEIYQLAVTYKNVSTALGKLKIHEEHYKNALQFSKTKAKIVDLQVYIDNKSKLNECIKQTGNFTEELGAIAHKQNEAERTLQSLDEQIKSLKEAEKSFGKVLHHEFRQKDPKDNDIRRNTRTSPKR